MHDRTLVLRRRSLSDLPYANRRSFAGQVLCATSDQRPAVPTISFLPPAISFFRRNNLNGAVGRIRPSDSVLADTRPGETHSLAFPLSRDRRGVYLDSRLPEMNLIERRCPTGLVDIESRCHSALSSVCCHQVSQDVKVSAKWAAAFIRYSPLTPPASSPRWPAASSGGWRIWRCLRTLASLRAFPCRRVGRFLRRWRRVGAYRLGG